MDPRSSALAGSFGPGPRAGLSSTKQRPKSKSKSKSKIKFKFKFKFKCKFKQQLYADFTYNQSLFYS